MNPLTFYVGPWRRTALQSVALGLFLSGCGRTGSGTGAAANGGGSAPQPQPPPPLSLQTSVRLDPFAYQLPALTDCLSSDSVNVPTLPSSFAVDGRLGDWSSIPTLGDEASANAPAGMALGSVAVAVTATANQDLAVAAVYQPPANASLNVEWGGLMAKGGALHVETRRLLRVYKGALQDFEAGEWQAVGADLGQVATGPDGTEILFTRRLLGDVVTWPGWWVRVFTRDEATGEVGTSTEAAYFQSLLGQDSPPFLVTGCSLWQTRQVPFSFIQVQDAPPPPNANPDPNSPEALAATLADQAFALARVAFDAAEGIIGGAALPASRLAVIATTNTLSGFVDDTGAGDAYVGDGALDFKGILIDLNRLAPSSTEAFPQGAIITEAAATYLDLYLREILPAAAPPLRRAVGQALLDPLTQKILGMAYWLDYFRPGVDAFIGASDAAKPVPIESLTPGQAAADAKVVGFGHILAAEVPPAELLAAWRAAAPLVGAGTAPGEALRQALVAGRTDQAAQARINDLWQGWMTAAPYGPSLDPSSLDTPDHGGIPAFYKRKLGLDPANPATAGDAWTDLSHLILGPSPGQLDPSPQVIAPDGDFADWQELLPKRIIVDDQPKTSACPKSAAIHYYAALATHDAMIVGADADDFWEDEPAARWEMDLDFTKENKQLLIVAQGDQQQYQVLAGDTKQLLRVVLRAIPLARKTLEIAISRSTVAIPSYFDEADEVKIRLRTVFTADGKDLFCDETDWFSPYIAEP